MGLRKLNYVTLDKIKREHAQYNWLIGERSNGKTFAVLKEMIENYVKLLEGVVGKIDFCLDNIRIIYIP